MNTDDMIRAARPQETPGWSHTPAAHVVLDRVLAAPRQAEKRRVPRARIVLGIAGALLLGTAGVATARGVFGGPPPSDWQNPGGQVACGDRLSAEADLAIFTAKPGEDAFAACERMYAETGEPAPPKPWVACVYSLDTGAGGGLVVLPGGGHPTAAESCEAAGMFLAPDEAIQNPGG